MLNVERTLVRTYLLPPLQGVFLFCKFKRVHNKVNFYFITAVAEIVSICLGVIVVVILIAGAIIYRYSKVVSLSFCNHTR